MYVVISVPLLRGCVGSGVGGCGSGSGGPGGGFPCPLIEQYKFM